MSLRGDRALVRKALLFVSLFTAWLVFAGRTDYPTALAGAVVAMITIGLARGVFFDRGHLGARSSGFLRRVGFILAYLPILLCHVLQASVSVARHALSVHDRLNPGIVKVKTRLRTRTGVTALANLITLTPGTLTIDFDEECGDLYIHWIDVATHDEAEMQKALIRTTEDWVRRILE
ncbi:MAG: Na+/H+ antiporter subunit E [Bacillota bacterium]